MRSRGVQERRLKGAGEITVSVPRVPWALIPSSPIRPLSPLQYPVALAVQMAPWNQLLAVLFSLTTYAAAYIPASPSNNSATLPDPANADSTILLRWTDQGNYQEGISRQLEKDRWDGYGPSLGIEKVLKSPAG